MTAEQKQHYAKQRQTEKTKKRDRIDTLVDALDRYYFRIGSALNELDGSTWIHEDCPNNIRGMFESERLKKDRALFYKNAAKAEAKIPGMGNALEQAASLWLGDEEDFYTLLGFILGLRIAGIRARLQRRWLERGV